MEDKNFNSRDHLANERTFLAWIRTSIAIIAFGFVIEKFSLFMKQMSFILGKTGVGETLPPSHGYSAVVGILLVAFGTMLSVLGFFKFKKTQKQIEQGKYQTSSLLEWILTLLIFIVGSLLVVYLIKSVS
jgi:uncharacterized membrane protein YidH (DUF202 family)